MTRIREIESEKLPRRNDYKETLNINHVKLIRLMLFVLQSFSKNKNIVIQAEKSRFLQTQMGNNWMRIILALRIFMSFEKK